MVGRQPMTTPLTLPRPGPLRPAYRRDLIGHGSQPPNARWPAGARIAELAQYSDSGFKENKQLTVTCLVGDFKPEWFDQKDVDGIAMAQAGHDINKISSIKRDASRYLGFVEIHIEQGPVLNAQGYPLGIVTSITGNVRYQRGDWHGLPCRDHAHESPP